MQTYRLISRLASQLVRQRSCLKAAKRSGKQVSMQACFKYWPFCAVHDETRSFRSSANPLEGKRAGKAILLGGNEAGMTSKQEPPSSEYR